MGMEVIFFLKSGLVFGVKFKKALLTYMQYELVFITKTCLFIYTENFTTKNWKFSDKNSDIFLKFLLKT